MQVTVSTFGRYHAFYLAHQLHKRGCLGRFITTYPKFEVAKYGIPGEKVEALVSQQLIYRAWNKLPARLRPDSSFQIWLHERFDKAASKRLPERMDLYVGWSSFSERGLREAKKRGAVTVVERGSSHIEYQVEILREEYEKYGLKAQLPHPAIIEKEKREYDLADYISIPSEFVRRTFLAKGFDAARLLKIPYGVDLASFRQVPREDDTFRVVFAGAMSLQKGVHYLLRAFAELKLPRAELWLLGARLPEIEPFFKKYDGAFRYFGPVPQAELHRYYSQCSVFALCSIQEGLAMVLPQAMACGLPLICTPNTGGEELITHGKEGFIVPARDLDALKAAILHLYEHRDCGPIMGQAAKQRAQSSLTWDDYGASVHEKYVEVTRSGHEQGKVMSG